MMQDIGGRDLRIAMRKSRPPIFRIIGGPVDPSLIITYLSFYSANIQNLLNSCMVVLFGLEDSLQTPDSFPEVNKKHYRRLLHLYCATSVIAFHQISMSITHYSTVNIDAGRNIRLYCVMYYTPRCGMYYTYELLSSNYYLQQ